MKVTFFVVLLVAFIDNMGVGLIYPLFSSMLFDSSLPLLPPDTSQGMRGLWLGILIALMPLSSFFSAPLWGALSDNRGRKKILQHSLAIGVAGYLVALLAVASSQILLLLLSRIIIGIAAGNMSIVQATIADVSTLENKAKNYGLYAMALGAGFTLGPFIGGGLALWNYNLPFIFAALITALNLFIAILFFKETHHLRIERELSWKICVTPLKQAFHSYGIRTILLCSFLHQFAWSYFFEFIPVYFIDRFQFSAAGLGLFYGAAGAFYALSTGLLMRPFVGLLKPELFFFAGNFFSALTILAIIFIPSTHWLWPLLFLNQFFLAFVWPNSITIISNSVSDRIQGEALGILSSVSAFALVVSPLCSGSLVGKYPSLPMWVGGSILILIGVIGVAVYRRRLFARG